MRNGSPRAKRVATEHDTAGEHRRQHRVNEAADERHQHERDRNDDEERRRCRSRPRGRRRRSASSRPTMPRPRRRRAGVAAARRTPLRRLTRTSPGDCWNVHSAAHRHAAAPKQINGLCHMPVAAIGRPQLWRSHPAKDERPLGSAAKRSHLTIRLPAASFGIRMDSIASAARRIRRSARRAERACCSSSACRFPRCLR